MSLGWSWSTQEKPATAEELQSRGQPVRRLRAPEKELRKFSELKASGWAKVQVKYSWRVEGV